jgi:CDP-diacylglycerol--serine O-phosphatidyltransferase
MDLKKANAIKVLVVLIIVFSMLYVYPIESTTLLITAYLLYGIVRTFYTIAKQKKT